MDKRISQLDLVTELDGNDVLPIVNGGATKKVKVSQLISSGGQTNLSYLPDPANGVIDNDNGTSATIPLSTSTDAGLFSPAEKTKLDGIETGAQVNVNADWNAISGDAEILNKPTIPSAQVNSDWNATSGVAQILNKPTIPDTSNFVPYTGATADLDLGTNNLNADHISLNVSPTGAGFVVGATQWNDGLGSSQTLLKGGSVTLKNGVDLVARIVNKVVPNTTLTKANYQVVRVTGASGQRLAVDLAQANNDLNSADTLGIVTETIATNQEGFILTMGQLLGINTTGSLQSETWSDGDVLYLSPTTAGAITNIKPTGATGHIVVLGYVEYAHAINGKIYIKIMNGWELDELHNCYIDSPLNNQVLTYESATDLWKNKSLGTILGYTPFRYVDATRINVSGTLTESILNTIVINGGTFNTNDIMKVIWRAVKTTALGTITIRLRSNTTNTLFGATLLATSSMSTANRAGFFMRHFDLIAGTITGWDSGSTIGTDMSASSVANTTNVYNTNNILYLFTTIQLTNVGDTITSNFVNVTN
jgi:nitrogen fixation protein